MIISEYSAFYPHLIRWPTSRDTAFLKMRGENQAGPLFTVNCVDAWMITLELDHFVSTSLYSNDNLNLVYLKNTYECTIYLFIHPV